MTPTELVRLRRRLARVDQELLRQLRHRLRLADSIGQLKRRERLPLKDYPVEREVIERWRRGLSSSGVSSERAERFAAWVIEESLRVQEAGRELAGPSPTATDILVVGGAGGMGGWMREYLRSLGHRVGIVDPRAKRGQFPGIRVYPGLLQGLQDASIVVVATPMGVAPSVYRAAIRSGLPFLLVDILSIKAPLIREIQEARARGIPVTSLHPLFGPGARTLSGRYLLSVDCGDPAANRKVGRLFAGSPLTLRCVPLARHDALMADLLGLPHLISLLFTLTLSRSAARHPERAGGRTTSFGRQAEVAALVTAENPALAAGIQRLNEETGRLLQRMERSLSSIRRAWAAPTSARYERLLLQARDQWKESSR
ncbi:MAG TPA: chorismate mutase [Thermoplasmata archaeon]|nr:chorismate mutase [Thermoplasmata archaeon]